MKQRAAKQAAAGPEADVKKALKKKLAGGTGGSPNRLIYAILAPLVQVSLVVVAARWLWQWWSVPLDYLRVLPVDRLKVSDPNSLSIFFEKYHGRLPVVFEGALDGWPAMNWSPATLSKKCPLAELPVYAYDSKSKEWAGLRESEHLRLSAYFDRFFGRSARQDESPYGLEMSLRNECPQALEDVRIPAPFTDDMLVRYYKKGAWPTLITGPAGTRSGLHRDSHNFPFWMALFAGRKHWRIFADGETSLDSLYQPDRNGFNFDPFRPDFAKYPALGQAAVFDHVLEAGQLLYIPNGAPHGAQNLEDTIAISGNLLDGRSFKYHMERTCQQPLWMESKLCWAYSHDFEKHQVPLPENMTELTYFKFAGYSDAADWCKSFLPELKARAEKRPELERCVPIVDGYCQS